MYQALFLMNSVLMTSFLGSLNKVILEDRLEVTNSTISGLLFRHAHRLHSDNYSAFQMDRLHKKLKADS